MLDASFTLELLRWLSLRVDGLRSPRPPYGVDPCGRIWRARLLGVASVHSVLVSRGGAFI